MMPTMMRTALFSAVVAALVLSSATPSLAYYEGPWCMKGVVGRSEINICHFRTFEQCLNERAFWGGQAFCTQNPRYLPYWRNRGIAPR